MNTLVGKSNVGSNLLGITVLMIVVITFLFDPDGAAFGTAFFEPSPGLVAFTSCGFWACSCCSFSSA